MVNIPTNYKMGTGLAATLMGGQAGLEQEKMGLENLSAIMKQPGEALQANKDMDLLNNPDFVKANTQFQLAASQAKIGDAEKQKAVNGLDILLSQLQMAEGDPQKQRQIVYQSFIEKGVDPTSPMAQAILADPYGRTKQARDDLVGTYGYTPAVAGKMQEQTAQDTAAMARLEKQIASNEKIANIRTAATGGAGGNLSTDKEYNKQLKLALAGDENAKRWVNTYIRNKQITNLQYGAPAFQFGQGGGAGQMTTKGATAELPFPDVSETPQPVTVTAGGKVYSFPNQAAANAFKQKAGIQ